MSSFSLSSNSRQGDFPGTLVDDSMKKEHTRTEDSWNQPYDGDTTSEGGYGGDPFSRQAQSPKQTGQFSFDRSSNRSAPEQQEDKENDDMDKHAGEGIIPPNEAAAAQAASSGTSAQARYNERATMDGSNIGG